MMIKRLVFFLLLLLVFIPTRLSAQKKGQQLIDSLMSRIEITPDDTSKCLLYNLIAFRNLSINPDESAKYARLELALAQKIGYRQGLLLGNANLGNAYMAKDEFAAAIPYLKKAYNLAVEGGKVDLQNRMQYYLGRSFVMSGQVNNAVEHLETALKYYTRINNTVMAAQINKLLLLLSVLKGNFKNSLELALADLKKFKEGDRSKDHIRAIINVAASYGAIGDFPKCLDYYQVALKLTPLTDTDLLAELNRAIAHIYNALDDGNTALEYDLTALKYLTASTDESMKTAVLSAIAEDYVVLKNYDKAIGYAKQSLALIDKTKSDFNTETKIPVLGQIAYIYLQQKQYDLAMQYAQKSAAAKSRFNNVNLTIKDVLAQLYIVAPDSTLKKYGINPAEKYQKAIAGLSEIANSEEMQQNLPALRDSYSNLSKAYEKIHDYQKAYEASKKYFVYRDSIVKLNNHTEINRMEARFIYEKKEDSIRYQQNITAQQLKQQTLVNNQQLQSLLLTQQRLSLAGKEKDLQRLKYLKTQSDLQAEQNKRKANEQQLITSMKAHQLDEATARFQNAEIRSKNKQNYYLIGGIAALLLLSFFIARNYVNQRKSNTIITAEKQRSDDLLLNILPADVAEELKEKGSANARLFDEVTVLFTDFVNFTTVSEQLSPQELVDELHHCFKAFDDIMATHNIEKIKTIGDAYLAVAGVPNADARHAQNAVKAAFEITRFIHNRKAQHGDKTFDIRIGIHSGSVVAGIVGVKKFAYDIWGDTVNTAARMEQSSQPGKINVSEKTYELVKDKFAFTYRGEIEAKNKGALKMYFVEQA